MQVKVIMNLKVIFLGCLILGVCSIYAQNTLSFSNPNNLYTTGMELYAKQKYNAAQKHFQEYIYKSPQDLLAIECAYYSASCALELFHQDAERQFLSFVYKYPEHPKSKLAFYDLGNFYFRQKNYKKAIEKFEKATIAQLEADDALTYKFNLGYSYFYEKLFDKAGLLFNEIKQGNHRFSFAASYYAGYINYKNNLSNEAIADFKKAEQNEAFKPLVPVMLLNVYYKQALFDQMITYGKSVETAGIVVKSPDEFNLLMAEAYFKKENYGQAVNYFEKFSPNGKMLPDTLYRYGYSLLKTDNLDKSIAAFKQISANNRLGQFSAYYLGISYLKAGNKPFAANAFTQSAEMKFDDTLVKPTAYFYAGKVNFDLRKFSEAIGFLKVFVYKYPDHPFQDEANELLGESYLNTSNFDEAISYIEKLKKKSERIGTAYQKVTFYKAMEFFNDGKTKECLVLLDKSLNYRFSRQFVQQANFWKGEALSIEKNYSEAINAYNDMPEADNKLTLKALYGKGYAYYNLKNYKEALLWFKQYVDAKNQFYQPSSYTDALIRLADCYYVNKNQELALSTYDRALATNPLVDVDYILFQKAVVLLMQGKAEASQDMFELLIRRFPNSAYYDNALFQKAEIDFKQNKYNEAVKSLTEAIQKRPNSQLVPNALLNRATAYENLQNTGGAENDLKTILVQFPQAEEARKALDALQQILNQEGRGDEFETALALYKEKNPQQTGLENVEFESTKAAYFNEKYPQAVKNATNFIKAYPSSNNKDDAVFFLADASYQLKDTTTAQSNFYSVIETNTSEYVARALRAVADIELVKKNYQQSSYLYLSLLKRTNTKKGLVSASLGLLENYYQLNKYDSAIYYANQVLTIGNASINANNKANLFIGKAYSAKGDTTKAMEVYLNLINNAQDEFAAEANYQLAYILFIKKQFKQSLDKLFYLNEKFANYPKWFNKSYLLIADNYVALNEIFQAKATLKSVIEKSKDKESVEKARLKLEAINKMSSTKSNNQDAE